MENDLRYSIDGRIVPTINGGAGSGNFGHLGRPGKVGGSAPTDSAMRDMSEDLSKYLAWEKKKKLITKMSRMRSTKGFDAAHEAEMRAAGFTDDDIKAWKTRVALREIAYKDKQARAKELRARAKESPEQTKAIDNVCNKITVEKKDETWLRNNCSPEMAQAFSVEMDKAIEMGIKPKQIRLYLNDAKVTNGSLGHINANDTYELKISKQILRDYETTKATREASGPNGRKWWTSDKINGTFSHEIGHAMEWEFIRKAAGGDDRVLTGSMFGYAANLIINQAKQNLIDKGISLADLRMNKDKKYISQYGRTNSHEAIAESFANPNYSELTKEIHKITMNGLTGERKQALDQAISRQKEYFVR